jgi:hypothetical protein
MYEILCCKHSAFVHIAGTLQQINGPVLPQDIPFIRFVY